MPTTVLAVPTPSTLKDFYIGLCQFVVCFKETLMETTFSSTNIDPALTGALEVMALESLYKTDAYGNRYFWAKLHRPADLPGAAAVLKGYAARLCTVTALNLKLYDDPVICLNYHFDVAGAVLTVAVTLDPIENSVPTITDQFINADWCERECAELYDLHVAGNTNPERLFLDESIDEGILNEIIPLSIMMNGACTTDMWEHIAALNLDTAPHSVFPAPEGPAEAWPPLAPHTPPTQASPLPSVTDELNQPAAKKKPEKKAKTAPEGEEQASEQQPDQSQTDKEAGA